MPNVIISDSSCLILLDKLDELTLLQELYGEVLVTPEILVEVGIAPAKWMVVRAAQNKSVQQLIAARFGMGEASAIALAQETEDALLIIDDNRAKNYAKQLGIQVTGTLGVLLEAKEEGVIVLVRPFLERIKQTNFRIDAALEASVLEMAKE